MRKAAKRAAAGINADIELDDDQRLDDDRGLESDHGLGDDEEGSLGGDGDY